MKGYKIFFEVGPRLGSRLGGQPTTRLNQDKLIPLPKGLSSGLSIVRVEFVI
jgi:hypothetical protein